MCEQSTTGSINQPNLSILFKLSIYLSAYLSSYLARLTNQCTYLSTYRSTGLPIYLSICRFLSTFTHLCFASRYSCFVCASFFHFCLPICRSFFIRQSFYLYWCLSNDRPWTYLSNLFCIYTMTQIHTYTDLAVCLHAYMPAHLHACIGLLILTYA